MSNEIYGQITEITLQKKHKVRVSSSFKYCYDTITTPAIEYGEAEMGYINLKEYAEDVHDPMPRNMRQRAKICLQGAPLFKFFLDGSRRVYKIDDIQYDKKVFPIGTPIFFGHNFCD